MKTLLLDTSGDYSSVLLAEDATLLGFASVRRRQLGCLHEQIRTILGQLGLGLPAVERIAVVTGPGSWTGLNIGVAAAKTLAQVRELPLFGISTLDVLALGHRWRAGPVGAILDARRERVYAAAYRTDEAGRPDPGSASPRVVAVAELAALFEDTPGAPLVVEYGSRHRDAVRRAVSGASWAGHDALAPHGLLEALEAAGPELSAEDAMALSPHYMQPLVPGAQDAGNA